MAHFLPPEHVRQVNKLEWPKQCMQKKVPIHKEQRMVVGWNFSFYVFLSNSSGP